MKNHQMGTQLFCFFVFVFLTLFGSVHGDKFADKCANDVPKVLPCLNFAKGEAATPTKECCEAATGIRNSEPECLCYIIQQTHKGSSQSKSLGIKEEKLLQLPSACNMKNATISDCPKLLELPAGSPDAAIFNSSSSATPSSSSSTGTNSSTQSQNDSHGSRPRSHLTDIFAVALSSVLVVVPIGFTF
ncbi:hypothetical protein L6164_033155 [Bauhinia variegata]|uniref:Uncharacterized protein n=1 Tax=Bauhinia variegata TaxID=167791 RepID=A0ACB9KQV4_BAUVA|nr:hypothetical protein L6164_033155 [Bauhinia variegata]